MFRALRFRFGVMFFLIFLAFFFDFMNGEFKWDHQTGICHEVDYQASTPSVTKCISGQNITTISKFEILIDLPTLMFVWGITFLGSYFKSGSLINKLERASHLSKDAGELAATVGAVLTFAGVFHEAAMASAFRYIFYAFFVGHLTAIILITFANYLRSKEEDNTQINNSTATSSI